MRACECGAHLGGLCAGRILLIAVNCKLATAEHDPTQLLRAARARRERSTARDAHRVYHRLWLRRSARPRWRPAQPDRDLGLRVEGAEAGWRRGAARLRACATQCDGLLREHVGGRRAGLGGPRTAARGRGAGRGGLRRFRIGAPTHEHAALPRPPRLLQVLAPKITRAVEAVASTCASAAITRVSATAVGGTSAAEQRALRWREPSRRESVWQGAPFESRCSDVQRNDKLLLVEKACESQRAGRGTRACRT